MDTKSLARSKRAHTQHHSKKSHSVHKPKGPGVSDNSKNQGNQSTTLKTKSPVQSRRVSALPSNWDRYDDELDSADLSKSQPTDVVLPKSKGADYLHLISEAQAESRSRIEINSDCLTSLDDLLHDEFSHVVGSLISARGEGILSWMADDNFVVEEDGSTSNHEPEFLTLNLNALEKMLEKVDMHERLYIGADLLPPDLCSTSQSKVSHDEEHTNQNTENELVQQVSSGKIDPAVVAQGEQSLVEAESLDQVKDIPILTDQTEKSSAIEADLDFLLSSFGESHTQPKASNLNPPVQKSSAFESELDSLLNSHNGGAESINNPANPSDHKLNMTGFDDVLDDLLESTSMSFKPEQNKTSSASDGKSKVLDDFDSWLDTI